VAISTKQIDELIALHEEKIAKARQKVAELQSELKGMQFLRDTMAGSKSRSEPSKTRSVSFAWKMILGFIDEAGENGASIDQLSAFVEHKQLDIQKSAIRSQLSNYKARGLVDALGEGQYRITEQGRQTIDDSVA
jgi:DNA-binding transcriptional ArsR family regulator